MCGKNRGGGVRIVYDIMRTKRKINGLPYIPPPFCS